jgi:cytochrome c oxidase assembly protein subunit 15
MIIQMVLGILTVMYAAPWYIAIFHQIGAILLLVLILQTKFIANFPQEQSLRS